VLHELKRVCYSLDRAQMACDRKQEGLRGGGIKSSPIVVRGLNPFEVDVSARKEEVDGQLRSARARHAEVKRSYDALAAEKEAAFKQRRDAKRRVQDVEARLGDVKARIGAEEAQLAEWREEDAGDDSDEIRALEDVSEFEAEEAALQRQIESKKDLSIELERCVAACKEAVAEVEARRREAQERKKELEREVAAVRRRLEDVKEEVKQHATQVEGIKTLIAKYQGQADEAQGAVDAEEAALDHMLTQVAPAHGYTVPHDTERTEEEIDAELAVIDKKLRAAQGDFNADDVTAQYHLVLDEQRRKATLLSDIRDVRDMVSKHIKKLGKQQKKGNAPGTGRPKHTRQTPNTLATPQAHSPNPKPTRKKKSEGSRRAKST